MFRLPVSKQIFQQRICLRTKTTSSFIRQSFIEYFEQNHGHKHVKSSSVVPLCDPSVPFVNAGMNQFKGVFLGSVSPPHPRVVNSQKCVRVGGKHNDLEVVGTDGHHHTFFEMLGNWSFGDYYKKEACQMAWDLLLGPYRLKPENLVVTYFSGDAVIGLPEDRECRDIWRAIGVPESRLKALDAKDNFWEMGAAGPCGPCTEIHYVNEDGSLTEIWNLVFIHCNRVSDGTVKGLRTYHVDTGMGLERMAAILQGVRSNYDTDLFRPIIARIEKESKNVPPYSGKYDANAILDCQYRRLADHARMIAVCLADNVFPATSLNLKQIMRKSFKISTDVFHNPRILTSLYDEVSNTIGSAYPELVSKAKDSKVIIEYEEDAYRRLRSNLAKKWKDLVKQYPEVEGMRDVEVPGFAQGYKELKEVMTKQNSTIVPGELVFKLYDTHGLQEQLIDRIAKLNNLEIDKKGFWKLLSQHKSRHKTAFKEQSSNKGIQFENCIQKLHKLGVTSTNEQPKYNHEVTDNKITFKPLKTKLIAILNEDIEWIDHLDPCEDRTYYLVTEDSNFYCEEGGQIADTGIIRLNNPNDFLKVESVFKIKNFVFHKGQFCLEKVKENKTLSRGVKVTLEINNKKRLNVMRNHTAVHLLNAAIRKVLQNSVVCQIGSSVSDKGLSLNLSVYGKKLSQDVICEAQDLVRESIKSNVPLSTKILDGVQLSSETEVLTVPGEIYPETGLRLVTAGGDLPSKELCCGTHVPSTGFLEEFCITLVKGAGGNSPTIHGLTGDTAKEVRELCCRVEKLNQVVSLIDPERKKEEVSMMKSRLLDLCGSSGAPAGDYGRSLELLDLIVRAPQKNDEVALQAVAEEEVRAAGLAAGGALVHFLRCSYLVRGAALPALLAALPAALPPRRAALLLGCAGGHLVAKAQLNAEMVTESFSAEKWLNCILPVFTQPELQTTGQTRDTCAMMTAKVSLITCEQQVQDAMRIAIKFAQKHCKESYNEQGERPTQNRRQN